MEAPIHESAPSTSQEDTKSKISSSCQNPSVQKNSGLNLQNLALNNIPPWAKLVLGSVVLFAIPLYRRVLKTQKLKKSVGAAVEAAEKAAEAAEKLAEAAEKVAEAAETMVGKVLDAFPGGRLITEEAAVFVDKNAEVADSKINKGGNQRSFDDWYFKRKIRNELLEGKKYEKKLRAREKMGEKKRIP